MLERVAVDPLIDVLHVPVFIRQLAGENTRTDIGVASFGYRRVVLNEHLMSISKIVSHEFVAIRLESLAHPLILEAEVLHSEQTSRQKNETVAPRAELNRSKLSLLLVSH